MTTNFKVKNQQAPGQGHGKKLLLTKYMKPNIIERQFILGEDEEIDFLSVYDGVSWTIEEIDG